MLQIRRAPPQEVISAVPTAAHFGGGATRAGVPPKHLPGFEETQSYYEP
jgi:hypothetical protein